MSVWYSVGFVSSSSDLVGMSVFLQVSATPSLGSPEAIFLLVLTVVLFAVVLSRLEVLHPVYPLTSLSSVYRLLFGIFLLIKASMFMAEARKKNQMEVHFG